MEKKPRKQVHLPPAVCTEEFKNEVQNYASEIDRSMSWVIVKALAEYMNNHPWHNKPSVKPPVREIRYTPTD